MRTTTRAIYWRTPEPKVRFERIGTVTIEQAKITKIEILPLIDGRDLADISAMLEELIRREL